MANEEKTDSRNPFITAGMPWLAGAAGLFIYLVTLNHWVSLHSLDAMDQVCGPAWQPAATQPVTWMIFQVFRLMPQSAAPIALNLFSAVCAALILVLLARTLALLSRSKVGEERSAGDFSTMMADWMPSALAAMAMGLELTFWEHATAVSGEMIDLLLFAYIVRCLFEFNADGKSRWLSVAAFLYGAGIANNWGMIGFFPAFLVVVIWVTGMVFFDGKFLLRMALSGLLGLSFYLLLPLAHSVSSTPLGFWPALKTNLRYQTEILLDFPPVVFFLLALTIFLPALTVAICRLPKIQGIGEHEVEAFMRRALLRLVHGLFLALSIWIVLDLPFSPRKVGLGQPLLSYYYINALVLGCCARFFLLMGLGHFRSGSGLGALVKLLAKIGAYAVCLLFAVLPVELILRNGGDIKLTNGTAVRDFSEQLYEGLPAGKSVAFSDSSSPLILTRAALAAHGAEKDCLLVDLTALPSRQYQLYMAREYGVRWPALPSGQSKFTSRAGLEELIARFAAHENVVCLNPGFGFYQEPFLDEPHGMVHYMVKWPAAELSGQHLTGALADADEKFWQEEWSDNMQPLIKLATLPTPPDNFFTRTLLGRAYVARDANQTATSLRNAYSRDLDDWGARLQRIGRWKEAGVWFQRALDLKPDNLPAHINQVYNAQHLKGVTSRLNQHTIENEVRGLFGKYASWGRIILDEGPVDEPTFLNETARVLLFEGNNHQAAADYARCVELAPGWVECRIWYAQSLLGIRHFNSVLELTGALLDSASSLDGMTQAQLLFCHVRALQELGQTKDADETMQRFTRSHRDQIMVLSTAVDLCIRERNFSLALVYLDELLDRTPNSAELLSNKAFVELQLSNKLDAVTALNSAIAIAPANQVYRLNRALALLDSGNLDAARGDYQQALDAAPNSRQALVGLAEIAWRKKDTVTAIHFCEQYLAGGDPQTFEYNVISNRLQTLKKKAQ